MGRIIKLHNLACKAHSAIWVSLFLSTVNPGRGRNFSCILLFSDFLLSMTSKSHLLALYLSYLNAFKHKARERLSFLPSAWGSLWSFGFSSKDLSSLGYLLWEWPYFSLDPSQKAEKWWPHFSEKNYPSCPKRLPYLADLKRWGLTESNITTEVFCKGYWHITWGSSANEVITSGQCYQRAGRIMAKSAIPQDSQTI